jgi:hypothetical protein
MLFSLKFRCFAQGVKHCGVIRSQREVFSDSTNIKDSQTLLYMKFTQKSHEILKRSSVYNSTTLNFLCGTPIGIGFTSEYTQRVLIPNTLSDSFFNTIQTKL